MQMVLDKRCGEQHAITDIYCAKRQRSLVDFPIALISLLIIAGISAFLLTGFVGYLNCQFAIVPLSRDCWHDPWYSFLYLKEPWAIYLWASAVVLTVQVAILRDPSLRRRLVLALVATLASIMIVGIVYLFGTDILDYVRKHFKDVLNLVEVPLTYQVINYTIVVVYLVGSFIRWLRHPDGLTLIGLRPNVPRRKASADEATIEELISGDLITGMALFFVMAQIFKKSFIESFYTFTTLAGYLNHKGMLPDPNGSVLQGISTADTVLALLCLFFGFMTLALTALLAGLAVLQGQDPAASQVAGRVSTEVAFTVLNALRAAITRQLRGIVRRVGFTLRRALWPLLLLAGSFSLALFGRYVQYYLHNFDPTYGCSQGYLAAHPGTCIEMTHSLALLIAIACGLGGVIGAILSTSLQVRSWRVAVNAFGLLRWVGFVLLITFWIFSVALMSFNYLLLQLGVVPGNLSVPPDVPVGGCPQPAWYNVVVPIGAPCTQPFIPLSYPTLVSFAAFLVVMLLLVVRMRQGMVRRAPGASSSARGVPIPRATAARTSSTRS